jgi:DNA-binding XRE family transcriptional regulator
MSYGYSAKTIELNKKASNTKLGVALGRAAIKKGMSVADIANVLNVSRQTVYNWFIGAYDPRPELTKSITKLIANRLSK